MSETTKENQEKKETNSKSDELVVATNKVVSFHYRMREIDDGDENEWLEDSFENNPVVFLCGHKNVIVGLENAMLGLKVGEEKDITIPAEDAYGLRRDNAISRVPIKHLHLENKKQRLPVGSIVTVQTEKGPRHVTVVKAGRFTVDVDFNHPFAGSTLRYQIKIEDIRSASPEEISHGHAHGVGGHQH
ncbi:peptidylprolyl isomerase [Aurantivibrio infirmus]